MQYEVRGWNTLPSGDQQLFLKREDGLACRVYLVKSYGNYKRWEKYLTHEAKGTKITDLMPLSDPTKINADSFPKEAGN